MISAKILLDSLNPVGNRLTTWILTYQRFIHSEFNTHRMFSRNATSSRAIPIERMIKTVLENPATPEFWGKNQSGMQAEEELNDVEKHFFDIEGFYPEYKDTINSQWSDIDSGKCGHTYYVTNKIAAKMQWLDARDHAVESVQNMAKLGLHKQITNRLLEPWMHITVVMSATEMENFFSLRAHPAAQPEFQRLAYLMLDLYQKNSPRRLNTGEWHIPFGDKMPENITHEHRLKIATARCARTSYLTFDGEMNTEKDYEIHDRLASSGHWSPFEHCAQALDKSEWSGNFNGWKQYRKTFAQENKIDGRVQTYKKP